MQPRGAIVTLLGLVVLLVALDSWMRGPAITLLVIAAVGLVLRNEQTIAGEFGAILHGGAE